MCALKRRQKHTSYSNTEKRCNCQLIIRLWSKQVGRAKLCPQGMRAARTAVTTAAGLWGREETVNLRGLRGPQGAETRRPLRKGHHCVTATSDPDSWCRRPWENLTQPLLWESVNCTLNPTVPAERSPSGWTFRRRDHGGPQGEEEGASLGSVLLLSAVESTLGSGGRAGTGLQGPSPAPWRCGHQLSPWSGTRQ